jgi:signal transduction histidine kinase
MLGTVLSPFGPEAADRRIDLRLETGDDLGRLTGDEPKLARALRHLVSNAIRFSPDGGRVTVRADRDGGCIAITVADEGPGIDPSDQERIFDAFAHGDHSSGSGHGSGLGLALARRYADLHGGTLTVRSAVGAGATFLLSLPLDRLAATPAEAVA